MSRQHTKVIDVTRSYVPSDPNSFPDNLVAAVNDRESEIPVMLYSGRNFLPTVYGVRSYFGTESDLDIGSLGTERVVSIFVYQNKLGRNVIVALCDSGIWYKHGATPGPWSQIITLTPVWPSAREWTFCVMDDKLYCYPQNHTDYFILTHAVAAPYLTATIVTPNFLNMSAQQGIFRAGGRLGFWDSANSVSWSALDDRADYTPSLETLANSSIFSAVTGRIVDIKEHGEGFLIYASRSLVYVEAKPESLFLWDPHKILDCGIAYQGQCVVTNPTTTHYAYCSTGIYKITDGRPEVIIPDVFDYLKSRALPKFLSYLEGRYLFIHGSGDDYVDGIVQFREAMDGAQVIDFPDITYSEYIVGLQAGSITFCELAAAFDAGQLDSPTP